MNGVWPGSCRVLIEFTHYFAAQTVQTQNAADKVFTQRGKLAWRFGGVGELPDGGGAFAANGITNGDPAFINVTDGSVVPVTTGTTMSDAGTQETFQLVQSP